MDVIIAVGRSPLFTEEIFEEIKGDYLQRILQFADIDRHTIHFELILFTNSKTTTIGLDLSTFDSRQEVARAVGLVPFMSTSEAPSVAVALDLMAARFQQVTHNHSTKLCVY